MQRAALLSSQEKQNDYGSTIASEKLAEEEDISRSIISAITPAFTEADRVLPKALGNEQVNYVLRSRSGISYRLHERQF